MRVEDLKARLPEKWQDAFVRFVQTGEADEAFLRFLDGSTDAQEAVEEAFTAQAKAFERFAKELQGSPALEEV